MINENSCTLLSLFINNVNYHHHHHYYLLFSFLLENTFLIDSIYIDSFCPCQQHIGDWTYNRKHTLVHGNPSFIKKAHKQPIRLKVIAVKSGSIQSTYKSSSLRNWTSHGRHIHGNAQLTPQIVFILT